ncbi:MAG: septal ring lytic transglycosylase RlpA family protein [Spirulina sp.]
MGYLPHPVAIDPLEEAPQVEQSQIGAQPSSAPAALASDLDPGPLMPLQTLASQAMQDLSIAVDWQRWTNTAAVTVVTTTALEATASTDPDLQPKTLTSATCPAAHPPRLEAKSFRLASSALAPAVKTQSEVQPSGEGQKRTDFVIRVKGVAVGQVSSAAVADQVAVDLREAMPMLTQRPQDLTPTVEGDMGLGQLQNETIFSLPTGGIDPDDSLAITTAQWVNNLRLALGAEPLNPGQVQRVTYGLDHTSNRFQGTASWYGPYFHGRQTATGEVFDQEALTAAHKTLPFNTYLEVRNLLNGKTVVVRINDRGPYVGDRSLDLSYAAARCLDSVQVGVIPYEATILAPDDPQAWEEAALPL